MNLVRHTFILVTGALCIGACGNNPKPVTNISSNTTKHHEQQIMLLGGAV
jgi:hypothetical protein